MRRLRLGDPRAGGERPSPENRRVACARETSPGRPRWGGNPCCTRMPYQTHWQDRGIVWEFHGFVTADEIEAANQEFYNDPRSDRAKYQIIDARDVTGVEWSDQDITTTAAHDLGAGQVVRDVRVASVSRDPAIIEKLDKYTGILRRMNSSWQFGTFGDLEAAREWAGAPVLDPPEAPQSA